MNYEIAHEHFRYEDGALYWKVNVKGRKSGDRIGSLRPDGYRRLMLNGKLFFEHRIIFLMHNGFLPEFIDHIDGNRANNRIENLREATKQQNGFNQKIAKRNISGVKGVCWIKKRNKWLVQLMINYKCKHIGYFEKIELAELAAQEARSKYHGEFANHGESVC